MPDSLKSVDSNFTLAVHSPKLDRDLNLRSVDQKLIVLTITPEVICLKFSKSIYVTNIVMRQKVSLGLSEF